MDEKSKILIIGGNGYMGKSITESSFNSGHPTFVLITEKFVSIPFFAPGVKLVYGEIEDHHSLVQATKLVEVVICTMDDCLQCDQMKIIEAIKEAGTVKRFFPVEFGNDVDHAHVVEPAKAKFEQKAQIRRTIEAEGIPYTFVVSYFPAKHLGAPYGNKAFILGDGDHKAIINHEEDIAAYTIKAVDDPRTLDKVLHIRPRDNIYSQSEYVSLFERKINMTLEKVHVSGEELLENIPAYDDGPENVMLAIEHSVFVEGDHSNFMIDPAVGVEASELYPEVNYTTMNQYLDKIAQEWKDKNKKESESEVE